MHSCVSVIRSNHLKALNERQESRDRQLYSLQDQSTINSNILYDPNYIGKRPLASNVSHMMTHSQYNYIYMCIHAWSQLHYTAQTYKLYSLLTSTHLHTLLPVHRAVHIKLTMQVIHAGTHQYYAPLQYTIHIRGWNKVHADITNDR